MTSHQSLTKIYALGKRSQNPPEESTLGLGQILVLMARPCLYKDQVLNMMASHQGVFFLAHALCLLPVVNNSTSWMREREQK